MSWFFKLNPTESEIDNLYQQIICSTTFKYFQSDNSDVLLEYKRFEAILVAAAIFYSKNENLKSKKELDVIYKDARNICYNRTSSFMKKFILSGALKMDFLQDDHLNEAKIVLLVYDKFSRYVRDVGFALNDHKPYFTEDWPGEYEDEVIERKILFRFISNLFLSKIEMNYDNGQYIERRNDWSIDSKEFELLERFANEFL